MPTNNKELIKVPAPQISEQLFIKRFDYAWDWFKVHAKQRTDMFNYFLLSTGLLANAYVNLRKDSHWLAAVAVAMAGFATSQGFLFLDVRNKFLVDKAALILNAAEVEALFWVKGMEHLGLSQTRLDRTKPTKNEFVNNMYRHGTIFQFIEQLVCFMWLVMMGGAFHGWGKANWNVTHLEVAQLIIAAQFLSIMIHKWLNTESNKEENNAT